MAMLHEDKTETLMRCFFEVQNEVGLGKQERAYQRGCEAWLKENGVPFASQPPHHLRLGGRIAHTLYPDLVVWDMITVELKAVAREFQDTDFVQLFDYLKCRNDRLGLLVNMGLDRVVSERRIYDRPEYEIEEDWETWANCIAGRDREVGIEVRQGLRAIFDAHGTGYGSEALENLIRFELGSRGLKLTVSPSAKAYYKGVVVDEAPLDCLLIEDRLVLASTALFDGNTFNFNRGRSFLRALNCEWGVAANFGKKKAQFTGYRSRG